MFAAIFLLAVWVPVLMVLRGALIQLAWRWFLIPVFPALHELSLIHAIGLSFVVGLFVLSFNGVDADEAVRERKTTSERVATGVIRGTLFYAFSFVLALIIHGLA